MSFRDLLAAWVVVLAWGVNFVVIKVGLNDVPPMLLGALRFTFAALPAIFFVKRPRIQWRWLLAYGLTISFGQFVFLFSAMHAGMPAGLASLVLQAQAFFTLGFAVLFLHESFRIHNALGLLIAALGLTAIGMQSDGHAMTVPGFLLTLCAALSWAFGNIVAKKIGKIDLLGLVVWASLVPPLPFLALSYALEGPNRMVTAISRIGLASVFAIAYLAFVATLLGYSLWGRLLSRYPAGQVAPFSLLVPIVGLASAAAMLGEKITPAQAIGIALVMFGLVVNVFGGYLRKRLIFPG
jgi:O-acetylserine/cysteine efflux transporter